MIFGMDVAVFFVGALLGVLVGIEHERKKFYDKDGRCRECRHPKVSVPDHADGYRWDRHHPNCPIGRLDV